MSATLLNCQAHTVVAAVLGLRDWQPTEFTAPDYQRFVKQPALLEISQQSRHRLVGSRTRNTNPAFECRVVVSDLTVDEELDISNATLDRPPHKQTAPAVRIGFVVAESLRCLRPLRLLR